MRQLIPSGNLLYVFDAAARCESFTKAAVELNVTPAAVSHAIRQLEEGLGTTLFRRLHRQLRITQDGAKLYQSVARGLDQIEDVAEEIHTSSAAAEIKVYASITVGTYWLLPRLATYPDPDTRIEMQLYNSDRKLDIPADGVSMAITNGRTEWPGYDVQPFAEEKIFPVCSPSFLKNVGPIKDLEALLKLNLLQLDSNYHDGNTWKDFLGHCGVDCPSDYAFDTYNNYILVIHAAIAGSGIGLGWQHSVGDLVENGTLVKPLDVSFSSGNRFRVVSRKDRPLTRRAAAVRDWLLAIGDQSEAAG
ncbi:LysR family transcriptional regulator [Tianweitania sp. BSSL-BM11]|uniref:LysR family transcriptional regulator n=1 Tax=Tianweitania aestuarii TaxID=2814886 RepID=A0ABS5RRN5_9HYPH|nr:LysR substrate-binding domain-containing protein [Tianweitania aestuarii]MBS9719718.1 LysR family transcriptional regulator [Tianweitania aestuarii]